MIKLKQILNESKSYTELYTELDILSKSIKVDVKKLVDLEKEYNEAVKQALTEKMNELLAICKKEFSDATVSRFKGAVRVSFNNKSENYRMRDASWAKYAVEKQIDGSVNVRLGKTNTYLETNNFSMEFTQKYKNELLNAKPTTSIFNTIANLLIHRK